MIIESDNRNIGRMSDEENNIFYTCGLIEYIARKTKNTPSTIINKLTACNVNEIYEQSDVLHSENIEAVSDRYIKRCKINEGIFNNVGECKYSIPSHWDIPKVYKRLVLLIVQNTKCSNPEAIIKAFNSPVGDFIEDYNSSFYYENPNYIYEVYVNGGLVFA